MNKLYRMLMSPEGEGSSGGGTATLEKPAAAHATQAPKPDTTSHVDAIAELFKPKQAAVEQPVEKPAAKEKPVVKPEAKVEPKKAPSLIEKITGATETPPTEETAPDAAAAAEADLPENKLNLGKEAKGETARVFGEIKTITKNLRTELAARDAKIKELETRAPAAVDPEIDRIKAEHKQALDHLAVTNLEKHPAFVRDFVAPKVELTGLINEALVGNGVEGVDLGSMVGKTRAEFAKVVNEVAAKLGDFDRADFVSNARKLYDLDAKAKAALGNAGELGKQLQAKAQAEQRAEFQSVVKSLGDAGGVLNGHDIPAHAEGDGLKMLQDYNDSVKNVPKVAEEILFGAKSNKELSSVAMEAAMFRHMQKHSIPVIQQEYGALLGIVNELKAELAGLKGSKQSAASAGSSSTAESKEKTMYEMTTEEAVAAISRKR